MNILIIGAGGREHAIGWKLSQSPRVEKLFFTPGNGGTVKLGKNIQLSDGDQLADFVQNNNIGLTVVGPEAPLAQGIVDTFDGRGLRIFGPTKKAARLETSKAWAVEFMKRHGIPHPESYIFTKPQDAHTCVDSLGWTGFVIKADGLAAGKGVFVVDTKKAAHDAINTIMVKKSFYDAGNTILIQERLEGYEVSIVAFADGNIAIPLLLAQDHKRAYDHDKGPNTGGVGAYAPVPSVDKRLLETIENTILQPTVRAMKQEGFAYKGAIYPGLMITNEGPKVLEYNARFGDPETQPQMMLLESDLLEIINACIDGSLKKEHVRFRDGATICVVLTADGYPGSYKKGIKIYGLQSIIDPDIQVFHAGTNIEKGEIVTDGGRVVGVTAYGTSLQKAHKKVYSAIGKDGVFFDGMQYRTDIAWQALKK